MSDSTTSPSGRLRVVVLGYLVRGPIGGMAWHYLQYVMGLRDLGHDVYFFEHSGDSEECCYDPSRHVMDTDPSFGLEFAADCFRMIGLEDRWAYHDAHRSGWTGPCANHIDSILRDTDVVINVSCLNDLGPAYEHVPVRVLVDTDPAFTQIRHLEEPSRRAVAGRHNRFFTFGENVGSGAAAIPDDGFSWEPTRQPVVLAAWPVTSPAAEGCFTTVMQWDSYAALEFRGRRYGMKSDAFPPYIDLPRECGPVFDLALGGASAPRDMLRRKGWKISDPLEVAGLPEDYRSFIQSSKAEFAIAKEGYVTSRSGWFSERSAVYLASGRPVVVQDTGFTDWLKTDGGVLAFSDPGEAAGAVRSVIDRYEMHCREARRVAHDYFEAGAVLRSLLERAMLPASSGTAT